jgi:ankyrin repeat protein
MVSCFKGYYEIVKLLLERKADVSKSNTAGQMPILFCFSRLEESYYKYENKKICMMMIDLLLYNGANINVTIDGKTILMKLISGDSITDKDKCTNICEVIKFLIERGADKSILSNDGKNVFELIKDGPFKANLISTIKNTERIVYYTEPDDDEKTTVLENDTRSSICCYIY